MNIKDAYIHNGDAILKDIQLSGSKLQKLKAGKKADDTYLGYETVCDLTEIKPNTAGTADKVGHKLTFSGGVTGTWDGSADKTVTIPTKSSWNYDDVYLKLTGNGTTNPLTGTIYIKDVNGIILNSKDKDLNIWEVYGNSGVWASQYGFNLQYLGTGSGNNNDLVLWAHNQAGTHVETYRVKQDGTFIFKAAPKVGTNVMYHAGNLTASVIGNLGTLSNNISGNAATATNADKLGNITADNYFKHRDAVFNSAWSGKYLWTLWDNHLHAADKRLAVTLTGTTSTNFSLLFDGSFESSVSITEAKAVLHIKSTTEGNVWTEGLPYGDFYVVFYNSDAENITGRVYCNYASQGTGWHDLTVKHVGPHIWKLHNDYYQLSDLEITITKPVSSASIDLCQVLHVVERSPSPYYAAVMSKYCDQKTNYNIEAAKFIKTGGTSSQFLKADGSIDSNTYSKSNHTHSSVLDINDSSTTTFAYSKAGLSYGDYTWLAGWNGYELRAVNKSQFAQASHTHTKSQITDFPTSLPASGGYAYGIESNGILDSQEKIDNFITPSRLEYILFKTTEANNLDFASNDGMLLSIPWNSTAYGVQLAFDDTLTGTIKVRGKSNSWGNWYTLLHSGNYTTYTVKKDGTGASGTWGINITGNAASATTLYTTKIETTQNNFAYYKISGILNTSIPTTIFRITTRNSESYLLYVCKDGGIVTPRITRERNMYSKIASFAWSGQDLYIKASYYSQGIYITQINGTAISYNVTTTDESTYNSATSITIDESAFLTSNVASSSKWATPRTITLTGSVTGSVSLDGSANVSLATTTNHTHTFDSLTSKPNTIRGYGIVDSIRLVNDPSGLYVGARSDYGENMTGSKYLEWWNGAGWVHHKAGKFSVPGGTSSQFLKADGSLDSTAYLPLSGGTMSNTNVVTNLNADLLDGYHAGVTNGSVGVFVPWPNATTMKNEGLMPSEYGTESYGYPDDVYLQSICKWAIAHYTNLGDITLIGAIAPNSSGTCVLHLYSSSGKDSSTLLPRYCSGTYTTLLGYIYNFGTYNYNWYYRQVSAGYASSAGSATTSTYASNVGSSGTVGTNYVTAANVISMYNWYNSITATDEASNTAIDKWNEIVSFLTGITDTSTLSGILAGYAAAGHNHDKTYLKLSGGTLTGSKNVLTLSNNSGGDIGLKFSRNTNTSWEIIDTGGNLKFNELFSNTTRLVLYENSQGGSAVFKGLVSATGFSKLNSSDSYLLLGGGGHKAVSDFAAVSSLNNYVLKKPDTRFYNYIGCSTRSNWYKITLPFHNTTSTNNRWMMVSMELILKGNYSSGADGTIYLSYYIYYPANNNIGIADKVYAVAIGSNMNNVRIAYNKTDLGIFYVYVPNDYNSFAIQNLSANDNAPNYDFTTTTIDALSSSAYPVDSEIQDINIRKLYTIDGTSLMLNGNVLIDAGNIGSQSVSYANSADNARNLLGRTTTGSDYGAVDGNLVFAEWDTYNDTRWYLKAKGYETRVGYANNSDKLDGQDLITQVSDWDTDSLSIFKSSEDLSSNAPTTDFLYGLTLRFHRNNSTYHTDLVSKLYSDALFFRRKTESGYGSWRELIHSGNISSQSVNYATNAGYAASAGNADTVDNMHASTLLHLDGYYYIPGNNNNSSTKFWSKIGSITFTAAWQQCGASLTFYEWEARHMMGELKFNIRTSSSKSNAGADIVWMNLTNKKFENSFIICRTGNGTYDIYFEYPTISYINIKFYIISQYDNGYITWQKGSALTSTEPTYVNEKFVSSLNSWVGNANYAIEADTASSANSVAWSGITDKPTFTTWSETSSTASYSLSNASWTNTITLPTTAGSYILNIVSGNSTLTGVFSIGASDNAKDEISLHLHGNGPRLYARTNGTTLQLSSNDASATSRSVTIKYRRMI